MRDREITAQQLGALAALTEDLSLFLVSMSGASQLQLWGIRYLLLSSMGTHRYMPLAQTYTYK